LGLDINVQTLPFQTIASVVIEFPSSWLPTATHEVADTHDTELSSLSLPLPALGLVTRDQTLPFDTITSVSRSNPLS
jgi:hypothetical protein